MINPSTWRTLGIAATPEQAEIRKAYAAKLKVTRPEDDPDAFQALRVAYEAAMRWARDRAQRAAEQEAQSSWETDGAEDETVDADESAPLPQSAPKPAVHVESAPPTVEAAEDPEQKALRDAFNTLYKYLRAGVVPLPLPAHDALAAILGSRMLENISLERRVEFDLAHLLASSMPASDALLAKAVQRFGWTHPQRQLSLAPSMVAILARVRDLAFLESLQSDRSPYAHAFRGLRSRKVPVLSWIQAHIHKSGRPNELQLLQLLRMEHPSLLPLLNEQAVAWWDKLSSRPQISFGLLALSAVCTAIMAGLSLPAGSELPPANAGITAALFAALVLGKLYLVDWPRHLIRRKWPAGAPPWIRLGWFPLCTATLLLSVLLPAWRPLTLALAVLSVLAMLWALIFRPPTPKPGGSNVLANLLVMLLVYNFLIGIWWIQVGKAFPAAAVSPTMIPAFGVMIVSVLGLPAALYSWEQELQSRQRKLILVGITLFSMLVCALLWIATSRVTWRPLIAALVLIAIALHRPIAGWLSRKQQEFRFGWMVVGFIGLIVVAENPQLTSRDLTLTGFGLLLTTTVVLAMLMALWNEWRGVTSATLERDGKY